MDEAKATRADRLKAKSIARREQQKIDLRRTLLDAATELFREHGFEGFSLRQVAERVGYSPTTVYLYFDGKDDLLFSISLDGFEQFGRALQNAYDATPDPVARIGAIGRAYIDFGVHHPAHYRLMFMERGTFLSRKNPKDQRPTIDTFGILVRAVNEAHASGSLRAGEPMALVHTLWAGVHGLVALTLCVPVMNETDLHARTDHLLDVLHKGFAERKE